MKRIALIFCLSFSLVMCKAQVVNEVCGVKFGDSYENCFSILNRKYGTYSKEGSDKQRMLYENISYAGEFFDLAWFEFEYDSNSSYLSGCLLCVICHGTKETLKVYHRLRDLLAQKYELTPKKNEYGLTYYWGGTSPVCDSRFAFCLDATARGNETFAVILSYGPYDYVGEEF